MSSGKQTLPQIPYQTTGSHQPEHYVGSALIGSYDIWTTPPTLIYYLTRSSLTLTPVGQKIPDMIFANVFDCDFSGKQHNNTQYEGNAVTLYCQAIAGKDPNNCHIWAFNAVVKKFGDYPVHVVELDLYNASGVDDPPWGSTRSAIMLDIEPNGSTNWIACAIGMNGPADGGASGKKGFRQAIHCDYAFDTVGLFLRSCVTNPDSYINLVPWDQNTPSLDMIKIQNAAMSKVVLCLQESGAIVLDNPLAGANAKKIALYSDNNGYFNIADQTDAKTLMLINALTNEVGIYNRLISTVITGGSATFLSGMKNTEAYQRILLNDAGLAIGGGVSDTDISLYRTGANALTITATVSVNFACANLLPAVWPCDIGSGSSNFRDLHLAGTATVGSDIISSGSVGHKGKHASGDGTQGLGIDVTLALATVLHFKDGLLVGVT